MAMTFSDLVYQFEIALTKEKLKLSSDIFGAL
jgi:hypothetical protein